MQNREKLGSRLGFILLSAGCAIGCGNVWKFPWMAGQYGGGAFVLVYLICLIILGLPVMTMEFSVGRAAQASPVKMYQKLEKPGQKWHIHGAFALFGNICLMAFYTVVTGWIVYYFVQFLTGGQANLDFGTMLGSVPVNVGYMLITVVLGFIVLCFNLQGGLERVTKIMMPILFVLMIGLAIYCCCLPGASSGLKFYLVPDFSKLNGSVIVGAMNQAFFTLSLGIGSMAIFGSYLDKDRSLLGESTNVVLLDTLVAICAGLIIFPACFANGLGEADMATAAGPGLLFGTMASVFNNMGAVTGRICGTVFFLFMTFAAFSTVLAVFENILACVRELTGWNRPLGCLVCGIVIALLALTTALGSNVWSGFVPFAEGSSFLDMWDFIVSNNLLPLGSFVFVLFCTLKKGWGWENFKAEANTGTGMKVKDWMRPIFTFVVPVVILFIWAYGLITFGWK